MTRKSDFMDKIFEQMNTRDAQIDKLRVQIEETSTDLKEEYHKTLNKLKEQKTPFNSMIAS
ncbi:MAG: hypothetical protein ISR54_04950 [Chlorobium phaeobacteroides]|uniref:Uncharacterized protein n=1 Tax=Chlorobium phaeobacteroides (strain BS1) TaxID=331678 RepID=B3EK07_CHLPB|nr:hypothetical protein [Chlorobium phaeobacteroides]NEX13642.1 hypothetical protein [Prosthecochloris sp.]